MGDSAKTLAAIRSLSERTAPLADGDMTSEYRQLASKLLEGVGDYDGFRLLVGLRNQERRGRAITIRQARMVLNIFRSTMA